MEQALEQQAKAPVASIVPPPALSLDDEIQEAEAWLQKLAAGPHPQGDFNWVADYAIRAFEETAKATDMVDEKAIKFIGFTFTAAGLIAAVSTRSELAPWAFGFLFAAVLLALIAATIALFTVNPIEQFTLPRIRTAWRCAEKHGEAGRALFAVKLHESRLRQLKILNGKSDWLSRAFKVAAVALWFAATAFFTQMLATR